MTKYRRKRYLTDKKYQIRYTSVIMLAMLMMAIVIGGLTYWDISNSIGQHQVNEIMRWDAYILRVFLLLAAAFLTGIFLSHKIIGPVRRIEKALEDINNGNFDVNLIIRSGDEFMHISDEINMIALKLKTAAEKDSQVVNDFVKNSPSL